MKYAILISLIFFAFNSGVKAQTSDSSPEKALDRYDRAWNGKDVKTVEKMLDDGYVYFSSKGSLSDKRSSVDFLGKPDYKLTFVKRSEIKVHSNVDGVAVISSRWQGKGSWSGGEIDDDQRCGQVFVKRRGEWKLTSEHCVQIDPRP